METIIIVILCTIATIAFQLFYFRKFHKFILQLGQEMSGGINQFVEDLNENLSGPMISKAMGIIGKQGGDRKSINAIKEKVTKGYIDKNLGVFKIIADKVAGIDVDELVEDYGAENILAAIGELGPSIGLNIGKGVDLKSITQNLNPNAQNRGSEVF